MMFLYKAMCMKFIVNSEGDEIYHQASVSRSFAFFFISPFLEREDDNMLHFKLCVKLDFPILPDVLLLLLYSSVDDWLLTLLSLTDCKLEVRFR